MPNADIRANQFTDKDTGQVVRFKDSVATFSNVDDMKDFLGLRVGQKVRTLGYYAPGDGGGNDYEIVAGGTGTDDGGSFIDLSGSGAQAKGLFSKEVSIIQFGGVGDGESDNHSALKNAIEFCDTAEKNLHLPAGHYYQAYRNHSEEQNWARVRKGNIKIYGDNAIVENHLIYVGGEYGNPLPINSAGRGSRNISFPADHGLSKGDVIQVMSSINAGNTDAGYYQLTSVNPTSLAPGELRLSEIHEVGKVVSPNEISLYGMLVYSGYDGDTSGYQYPLDGVTSAEVRKLDVARNVTFEGIHFKTTEANHFRAILARAAVDITFDNCFFEAGGLPGQHFKCTDVKGVRFINCSSLRFPENVTGSSWNSFMPGSGTSHFLIQGCRFEGEGQTFDFTPGMLGTDLGGPETIQGSQYSLSVQHITVTNNHFIRCDNTITTHPGVYDVIFSDNIAVACSSGFTCRSLKSTISGNTLECYDVGITATGFHSDLTISNNKITRVPGQALWAGIELSPMTSEVMSQNNAKRVTISNNNVYDEIGDQNGIRIRHYGNGNPVEGFTGFTDDIKSNLSDYTIEGNNFTNCGVWIGRYMNGVSVIGNRFKGGSGTGWYIAATNGSANSFIDGNVFLDDLSATAISSLDSTLVYDYDPRHTLGINRQSGVVNNNIDKESLVPYLSVSSEDGSMHKSGDFSAEEWSGDISSVAGVLSDVSYIKARFTKVGRIVTVTGRLNLVATGAGTGNAQLDLPIPSSLSSFNDINGMVQNNEGTVFGGFSRSSANRATLSVTVPSDGAYTVSFYFSYEIL